MGSSTYRLRPDRFFGVPAVGVMVLGVAALLWAFGVPRSVLAGAVTLGGLILLAGLWILARPPVLARLSKNGVEVRGVRHQWSDITDVGKVNTSHGEAIALNCKDAEPTLIPLRWLRPARASALQVEIRDRLNDAHGYRTWDGS